MKIETHHFPTTTKNNDQPSGQWPHHIHLHPFQRPTSNRFGIARPVFCIQSKGWSTFKEIGTIDICIKITLKSGWNHNLCWFWKRIGTTKVVKNKQHWSGSVPHWWTNTWTISKGPNPVEMANLYFKSVHQQHSLWSLITWGSKSLLSTPQFVQTQIFHWISLGVATVRIPHSTGLSNS